VLINNDRFVYERVYSLVVYPDNCFFSHPRQNETTFPFHSPLYLPLSDNSHITQHTHKRRKSMKYIDHPATSELNVLIESIDYNQARCIGRLEIYSCKTVPLRGTGERVGGRAIMMLVGGL